MRMGIAFLGIGLLLLILGIGNGYNQWQFTRSAVATEAVVVNEHCSTAAGSVKTLYTPRIFFVTATGETFDFYSRTSTNFSLYSSGEKVRILYNPKNPYEAELDKFFPLWGGCTTLIFLGLIFTPVSVILYLPSTSKRHKFPINDTNSLVLQTSYLFTQRNSSICINGDSPYTILTRWIDPQNNHKSYTFKSENLWYDPQPFIEQRQLTHISVRVACGDYSLYTMYISLLPQVKNPPI